MFERVGAQRARLEDRPARGEADEQREHHEHDDEQASDRLVHWPGDPAELELADEARRGRLRAQLVVEQAPLLELRELGDGHAGDEELRVQAHAARQRVRQAVVDRHLAAGVGADEVDRLRREQPGDATTASTAATTPPIHSGAGGGARGAWCARLRGGRGAGTACARRRAARRARGGAGSAGGAATAARGGGREVLGRRVADGAQLLRRAASAAARADLLDAEQDDRDVVAAARGERMRDELVGGAWRGRGRREDLGDRGLADHRGEAVAAQQEDVAGGGVDRERVDLDIGLGAERARDDRALRVLLGLLLGQAALAQQLLDERVVLGDPLEPPSRQR